MNMTVMKKDYFIFKTQISFSVKTDVIEPDEITKELGFEPNRFFKKGDIFTSKYSSRIGHKQWSLWTIDSAWTQLKEETVRHHIEYFKEILLPKVDILKRYKEDNRFELSFWISVKTDDAGFSLDLDESEMDFLNAFSNRVHFSLLTEESPLNGM
jgi:predicted ATP-dependent Lon-type protease